MKPLLAVLSVAATLLVLEMVFRTPLVTQFTGGDSPGLIAFQAKYDRLWNRHPLRFRTPYLPFPKTESEFRIVVVGDSFTWGDKIADSRNLWTSVLERRLNERSGGHRRCQVINLARCGYTTVAERHVLFEVGYAYAPDLVIVQFHPNDALPTNANFTFVLEGYMYGPPQKFGNNWS